MASAGLHFPLGRQAPDPQQGAESCWEALEAPARHAALMHSDSIINVIIFPHRVLRASLRSWLDSAL